MSQKYKVFLSYSHAADAQLAARLQHGLKRIGTPWFKPSTLRVFRDETGLEVGGQLRQSLEQHLEQSEYFLLLASPDAAVSRWVIAEVEWWRKHRGTDTILLLITGGSIEWDPAAGDFDWRITNCLPAALRGQFADEPLFVDLRWASGRQRLTLKDERFRNAVLTLAATLYGRPREELDIEDRRAQRRFRSIAAVGGLAMLLLAIIAFYGWTTARQSALQATQNRRESESRRLTARALELFRSGGDLDDAIRLAVYAWRLGHTAEAARTLSLIQSGSSNLARILGQHTKDLQEVAFLPNSARMITLSPDGIQFYRVGSWDPSDSFLIVPLGTESVQFDSTGRHMLVHSFQQDSRSHKIVTVDLESSRITPISFDPYQFGTSSLTGVTMNADGTQVAMAWQWHVVVWDVAQDRARSTSPEFGTNVQAMHFIDRDHLMLIAGTLPLGLTRSTDYPPQLQLWDLRSGNVSAGPQIQLQPDYAQMHFPKFNRDGSLILWREGYVPVLLERHGLTVRRLLSLTNDPSPQGYSPVAAFDAKSTRVFVEYLGRIVVWDLSQRRVLQTIGPFAARDNHLQTAAMSPEGRWLASLNGGKVHIWDLNRDGAQVATIDQKCSIANEACLQMLCDKLSVPNDATQLRKLLASDPGALDSLLLTSSCRVN